MISAIISHKDNLREDELKHHGILGQKWGVRRYQNTDGSYTAEGRERYGIGDSKHSTEILLAGGYFDRIKENKQIKKKQKELDKLLADDEKKHPYTSNISYKDLKLGEKYEGEIENVKTNASAIADQINDDWKDFIDQAQIYQAALGLLNKPADADDAARSIWFTVCEDGDNGLSATIYAQEKGIFESTKKHMIDFLNAQKDADNITRTTLIEENGIADDTASQLAYNVSRKMAHDIEYEEMKKSKSKGDNVLVGKNVIGAADLATSTWKNEDMDKETADRLLKVPRAIARGAGSKSTDNYWFWNKVLDAVTNLGYSDIPYDEMTEAQWEKVGKEMADLS